jgi:dipeptidyl aminopeptidase/acylaminoacyl peptidase
VKDATSETEYEDLVVIPAGGGKPVAVYRDLAMPEGDYFGSTYRWTPDSRRIVYMKDRDLWIADIAEPSAAPRRLGASLGRLTETPLLLTRDGGAIVVGVAPERGKTSDIELAKSLAVVPLDGSAPRLLDTTGTPVPANGSAVWQPDGRSLYVVRDAASEGDREIVRVDTATGAATRVWSGRARFNFVGAAGDGVVARYEATATPPDFYLFNRDFERVRRLSDVEPRLAAVAVGPLKTFTTTIPLYDHTLREVRSTVFLPPGASAGEPLPTIVYFYSGVPFSLYANDFGGGAPNTIPVPIFTTRGYAVLMCDVPLGPETRAANPVQEMTDAVLAQVYRAAALGVTDIKRVAVMGHSYGGYSTAAIVSQTQLFRAAIALDGFYDLPGDYGAMGPGGTTNYSVYESGQARMGVPPWPALQRYLANSPYYAADKIRTPLLLIHGEKDGACPVTEARKMFNALRRVGADAELATYAGEGHVTGRWALANAVDAAQRMLDFLAAHVK